MRRTPLKRGTSQMKRTPLRRVSPNKVKYKKPKGQVLKKKLDAVFSQYIRHKYARDGMVACYTCTTVKPIASMQNGHWIPRNVLATRFNEENCRPQCVGCNMFQKGKPDVFAVNLMKEGVDIEALQKKRYDIFKVDPSWYEEKIAHYKQLLEP